MLRVVLRFCRISEVQRRIRVLSNAPAEIPEYDCSVSLDFGEASCASASAPSCCPNYLCQSKDPTYLSVLALTYSIPGLRPNSRLI